MTVLIATDFSENSKAALRVGVQLAALRKEQAVVLHVVDLAADDNAWRILVESPEELESSARVEARKELEEFIVTNLDEGHRRGLKVEVRIGNPIDEILEVAGGLKDPVVVSGTRGKNMLQQLFLGSTASRMVRRLETPVVMVPPHATLAPGGGVVVAMDFSDASREALRHAVKMAALLETKVDVIHGVVLPEVTSFEATVTSTLPSLQEMLAERREQIQKVLEQEGATDAVGSVQILTGSPAPTLRGFVEEEGTQLLIMGSHGRRGWSRFFLGNTAERLLRRTPCALYLVRTPPTE